MSFYDASKIKFLGATERERMRLFWRDDMENYKICKWTEYYAVESVSYVQGLPRAKNPISAFEGDWILRIVGSSITPMVYSRFGALDLKKHSFEVRWYQDETIMSGIRLALLLANKTQRINAEIRYLSMDDRWRCLVKGGNYTTVYQPDLIGENTWNYLKLIVDFENNRYDRFITNRLDVDLTSHQLPVAPAATAEQGRLIFQLGGFGETPPTLYFDDARIYLHEE